MNGEPTIGMPSRARLCLSLIEFQTAVTQFGTQPRPPLFLMVNLSARPLFFQRRLNRRSLEMPSALAKLEAAKLGCFAVTLADGSLWRGETPRGKTIIIRAT
jgi:hypothetical protein